MAGSPLLALVLAQIPLELLVLSAPYCHRRSVAPAPELLPSLAVMVPSVWESVLDFWTVSVLPLSCILKAVLTIHMLRSRWTSLWFLFIQDCQLSVDQRCRRVLPPTERLTSVPLTILGLYPRLVDSY